jgi:hypothetical protein
MARWQWCEECCRAANASRYVTTIKRQVAAPWWILKHGDLERKITDLASDLERLRGHRIAPSESQNAYLADLREDLARLEGRFGGRAAVVNWHLAANNSAQKQEAAAILDVHHAPNSVCTGWADSRASLARLADLLATQGAIRTAPVSKSWGKA